MTLGFSQIIDGKPTYFIEKYWESILPSLPNSSKLYLEYQQAYLKQFGKYWDGTGDLQHAPVNPKPHTIRRYNKHEDGTLKRFGWKVAMLIHPVVNNRTNNRFQFAPALPVKSVQEIEIKYNDFKEGKYSVAGWSVSPRVIISGRTILEHEVEELSKNDGFDNIEAFLKYFNTDFKGAIIHWTDLKY